MDCFIKRHSKCATMKHIKEILAERQASLFAEVPEKGSSEWSSFNIVREDTVGAYRVRVPQKPIVIHGAQNLLRIIYPRFRAAH
jgi:hypothetical protein